MQLTRRFISARNRDKRRLAIDTDTDTDCEANSPSRWTRSVGVSLATVFFIGLLSASLVGVSGCGGKQSSATESGSSANSNSTSDPDDSDEGKLARAQMSTCAAVCDRLVVTCSVEDAEKNLDEEQLEGLNLAETLPAAVAHCEADCEPRDLSPRQLQVARDCVNGPGTCSEFVSCLDAAK